MSHILMRPTKQGFKLDALRDDGIPIKMTALII